MIPWQTYYQRLPTVAARRVDETMTDYVDEINRRLGGLSCVELAAVCRECACGVEDLAILVAARTNGVEQEQVEQELRIDQEYASEGDD